MSDHIQPLFRCEGLTKSFAHVRVLENVSLSVPKGSILGVAGENGAGKSTLMNLIGGVHLSEAGRMWLAGQDYRPRNPLDAQRAGISFVHQELNLFPNLSIADNLFLSDPPTYRVAGIPIINNRLVAEATEQALRQAGLRRHPSTLVESLSPGDRQLVEIAKALHASSRLIILDEPTTSVTATEVERLFALLRSLRDSGVTMIYISHALDHLLRLCEDIVVLRDGRVVESGKATDFTEQRLIRAMVGRDLQQLFPGRPRPEHRQPGTVPALQVDELSEPGVIDKISFSVASGEIVGIAGLMGSGRTELARILFGLDRGRGRIVLNGEEVQNLTTAERIQRGMALVTESRRDDGLFMDAPVAENLRIVHGGDTPVTDLIAQLRIVCSDPASQPVSHLSGGNQQKTAIAKWLAAPPTVFILDEPTRGIDVGAKQEIYELLAHLANQGMALLVISSEIDELLGLCDRIVVMARGEIRQTLAREEATRENILRAAV